MSRYLSLADQMRADATADLRGAFITFEGFSFPCRPIDIAAAEAKRQEAKLRYRRPPGECAFCDARRNDSMMPPHTASARCESGKHPHCTCDVCF